MKGVKNEKFECEKEKQNFTSSAKVPLEKFFLKLNFNLGDNNSEDERIEASRTDVTTDRRLTMENLENEIWKDIRGFEGRYQVSNLARVKSIIYKNHKIKKPQVQKDGYVNYQLTKKGSSKLHTKGIHALMAEAFLENPEDKRTPRFLESWYLRL